MLLNLVRGSKLQMFNIDTVERLIQPISRVEQVKTYIDRRVLASTDAAVSLYCIIRQLVS